MQEIPWPYKMAPADFVRSKATIPTFGPTRGPGGGDVDLVELTGSLISSVHGKLTTVLLWAPSHVFEHTSWCMRFQQLICMLPADCEIVIAVNDEDEPEKIVHVHEWMNTIPPRKHQIVRINKNVMFSIWAQDPFVVIQSHKTKQMCFVEPVSFSRYADSFIPDRVAACIGYHKNPDSWIYFQGGNLLVADDFYLLGYDYIHKSIVHKVHTTSPSSFVDVYTKALDPRPAIIINYCKNNKPARVPEWETPDTENRNGTIWWVVDWTAPGKYQPVFHIDMFMSLGGRNSEGKYKVFVGDPTEAAKALGQAHLHKFAKAHVFDSIIRDLESRGDLEVIRTPLPLVSTTISPEMARKDLEMNVPADVHHVALYYFATYNNCLVEIDGQSKQVWIPTYGHDGWGQLAATDYAVEKLWECHGFTVHRLGNFHPFMLYQGGPHCLTKYLARELKADSQ
ncbi:hypothetical protein L0222_19130 [bacterium]|nr:hypothetical protein [bacterium]MCI0605728.1 hypothetical protein [bacterium]